MFINYLSLTSCQTWMLFLVSLVSKNQFLLLFKLLLLLANGDIQPSAPSGLTALWLVKDYQATDW